MSTRFGRLEFEYRPEVYQHSTGRIVVSGVDFCDSVAKADFRRASLVAMPTGEEWVPLVIEDGFSGMVRPLSVSVDAVDGSMGQGWYRWSVEVEPVPGAGMPVVESVLRGAARQGAVVPVDNKPFHAVPGHAEPYQPLFASLDGGIKETRTVEGGSVLWSYVFDSVGIDIVYNGEAQWQVPPGDWYEGACYVDEMVDAEYLTHTVGGLHLETPWLLGNGMVRITTNGTGLRVSWFSTSWSTPVEFEIGDGTEVATWQVARSVHVGPERCSVNLVGSIPVTGWPTAMAARVYATLTVRRGSPWVDVRCTLDGGASTHVINAKSATAVDDQTWGMSRDVAASGWQWVVAACVANTVTTGTGVLEYDDPADGVAHSFGIGASHSSWTGQLALADVHEEWYAAQGERTVIGNRL